MTNNWELLSWDSDFFGFPVARIQANTSAEELPSALAQLRAQGVQLAYWILESADASRAKAAEHHSGVLVDEKTTFAGTIDGVLEATAGATQPVGEFFGAPQGLRGLALAAGVFSRFRVDPKMKVQHFEGLYTAWLERSVRREIAKAVYVTGGESLPTGFVTVGVKNERVDIGLIAVDEKVRGAGCGKALVRVAAGWGRDSGFKSLQVVTQGANDAACGLYRRCGLGLESMSPVFHFWPQA